MSESGVVHQYENNNNNNSHFSQQKNVLDSTKSNANNNSNDNIESAAKPFGIVKYIDSQFQLFDKKARETRQKQEIENLSETLKAGSMIFILMNTCRLQLLNSGIDFMLLQITLG
jgi:hypothetical protein